MLDSLPGEEITTSLWNDSTLKRCLYLSKRHTHRRQYKRLLYLEIKNVKLGDQIFQSPAFHLMRIDLFFECH
jgi:hypothetical protein